MAFLIWFDKCTKNLEKCTIYFTIHSIHTQYTLNIKPKDLKSCKIFVWIYCCSCSKNFHVCNWEFREVWRWSNLSGTFQELDKHIKFPLFTKSSPHKPSEKRTKIPWFHSSCWQKIFQMTPEPLYRLSMSARFGLT